MLDLRKCVIKRESIRNDTFYQLCVMLVNKENML